MSMKPIVGIMTITAVICPTIASASDPVQELNKVLQSPVESNSDLKARQAQLEKRIK